MSQPAEHGASRSSLHQARLGPAASTALASIAARLAFVPSLTTRFSEEMVVAVGSASVMGTPQRSGGRLNGAERSISSHLTSTPFERTVSRGAHASSAATLPSPLHGEPR